MRGIHSNLEKFKKEVISMFNGGSSLTKIVEKFHCDYNTLKAYLKKWGLKYENKGKVVNQILERDRQKIIKIHQNGFNLNKIAKMYNVDRMTLVKRFGRWNEPISTFIELKNKEVLLFKDFIVELHKFGYSPFVIADKLRIEKNVNFDASTIEHRLEDWGLTTESTPRKNQFIESKDGHKVRSSNEVIIDNFLYENGIKHEIEKYIGLRTCKTDFYLNDIDTYVEFWGSVYRSKTYFEKLNFYRRKKLKLYSIYPFDNLSDKLDLLKKIVREKKVEQVASKPKLWYFPLERLPERYTIQLHSWLERTFLESEVNYETIERCSQEQNISKGQVLDFFNTIIYKCEQNIEFIKRLCEFREGDKLFFSDIWHTQLVGIIYPMVQMGLNIDIYGLLHAGSWDDFDFLARCGMGQYVRMFEKGIFKIAKKIFVGSKFHKDLIIKKLNLSIEESEKMIVTGMPFQYKDIKNMVSSHSKEHQVIFPNRFNMEKDPMLMLDIMDEVLGKDKKAKLVITTSHKNLNCEYPFMTRRLEEFIHKYENRVLIKTNLTKKDYYQELAKSKVVLFTSKQETFGYCLAEGVTLSCTPVCPNKLSYVDILNREEYLYSDKDDAVKKVLQFLHYPKPIPDYFKKYENNINVMLKEMELV